MRRTQNILVGIMLVDNTVEDFIRVQDGESENDRQGRDGQSVFSALYNEQPCLRDESGGFEVS